LFHMRKVRIADPPALTFGEPNMSKTTPGLRRLRASPAAETIRAAVLADQTNRRAEALAKIEAEAAQTLTGRVGTR
jgi:hypothetical protein